jgi:signal transduction histidine kinase
MDGANLNQRYFTLRARACAAGAILIGTIVLLGWILEIPILRSFIPHWVEMKSNTALGYVCTGLSLWLLSDQNASQRVKWYGHALGWFIILLGTLTTSQYLFGWDLGIDQILFKEPPGAVGTSHPNRMAVASAVNFILKGIALVGIDWEFRRNHRPSQYLSLITAIPAIQALVAYSYGVQNVLGGGSFFLVAQMAVPAALAWLLLSLGTLLARPDKGILRPFLFDREMSFSWRNTIFIAIFVPPLFGFWFSYGAGQGYYEPAFGYSLLSVTCVVIISGFIWRSAIQTWRVSIKQRQAEDGLRSALSLRDEFLSIASHELKTPLTTLKLHTQITKRNLQKDGAPLLTKEALLRFLSGSDAQIERLTRLIEDMLDVVRIESGKLSLSFESVDLAVLLRNVCEQFSPQLEAAGCKVSVESSGELIGEWDPYRIEQVLVNLLSNAMKYGEGKPIQIFLQSDITKARMIVRDQGAGIDPKDHGRVFERFERAVSVKGKAGLGLGLFIARKIVNAHEGQIFLESAINKGSSFTVELPLKRQVRT